MLNIITNSMELGPSPGKQPLKIFPPFYGTRRFIILFPRAPHWSLILGQITPVHTTPSYIYETQVN
jgi:hypothetical protein